MGTEITKKENMEVSTIMQGWDGVSEGVDRADVLMPAILLMQGLSEMVGEEKAQIGDMVKSTTRTIIGNKQKPVPFIPLMTFKTWRNFEKAGEKFEFRGQDPYFEKDKDLPWTFERDGKQWRRDKTINVYALLVDDVLGEEKAIKALKETGEIPTADQALLPVLISFTRTSFTAGKTMSTHFAMAENYGYPPAAVIFNLKSKMEKNEKGHYCVYELERAGKTEGTHLEMAKKWFGVLRAGKLRVDESAMTETAKDVATPVKGEEVPF